MQANAIIQSLYCAYGSNLSLEQMATRCPESRYIGLARLHDYRWQINQRGYANVVSEPGNFVEGLCYILSGADEARLDGYEGVPLAYEKAFLEVELFTAKAALVGRDVAEIVAFGLIGGESRRETSRPEAVGGQTMTNKRGGAMPGSISSHPQLEPQNEKIRRSLENESENESKTVPGSISSHPQLEPQNEKIRRSLESESESENESKRRRLESPERGQPEPSARANTLSNFPEKPPPSPPRLLQHSTVQQHHSSSPTTEEQSGAKLKWIQEELSLKGPTTTWWSQGVQADVPKKHGEKTLALVYINFQQTTDDLPRQEYIIRMHRAIRDGWLLGMSHDYISTQIIPRLHPD